MANQQRRFTVYDMMDNRGDFDNNPANPSSRNKDGLSLYKGPQAYPKMFYHPEGLMRVVVPAEMLETPLGVKMVGEQKELIYQIAQNEEEGAKLVAEGWLDHPAKAMRKAGHDVPKTMTERMAESEAENAALRAQLLEAGIKTGTIIKPQAKVIPAAPKVE